MITDSFNRSVAAVLALSSIATAAPSRAPGQANVELSLTAQLQLADTAVDRYRLLPNDEDFIFDFKKSPFPFANRQSFPALVGSGLTLSLTEVPACGMASLHIHPRAAEAFAVVSGRIVAESVPEVGVLDDKNQTRVIRTELGPNQMTIFAAGAFHVQVNPDCVPATIVAAFSSEDPGSALIAPQTFALSDDIVAETFGNSIAGQDIEKVRKAIPPGPAFLVDECLAKCKLPKNQA
ncbi:Spherulin-1A [Paramyrothecium foliicola]|nr:Spherulin-1A [Paramyrothecium foliicola]